VTKWSLWNETVARDLIDSGKDAPGALLPILHMLQETFGYIDRDAEPLIAEALNISRAEVHGVVTFYHDFRRSPPPVHTLKLCRAEACQSMGGDRLAERATARLGVGFGETTPDGRVGLEPVYCLGLCSAAPSAMLDGKITARLDEAKLDALLTEAAR
jgi:formate dehydrogenase subunit gamma